MRSSIPWLAAGLLLAASPSAAQQASLRVVAKNDVDLARRGETIELSLRSMAGRLRPEDLPRVGVRESRSTRDVLAQAVDSNGDGVFDQIVFQADFAPRETKTFLLSVGERRAPRKEDFRVYGRFVRERFDDFAWENDRVAHRMYGVALETWEKEPLTSSGVDVWCKRTRRLVINDWYMVDDYHRDHGEGADLYSAGKSRGCGGSGIWRDGRLYVSKNFRDSRVIANGPIRLVFELSYPLWEAGGAKVSEKKRVTLDAGSNLNRFESHYTLEGGGNVTWAAGIKKAPGSVVRVDRQQGWLRTWEAVKDGNGHLGCGIVLDPTGIVDVTEADGNALIIAQSRDGSPATYYAGFGWDRSGDFADVGAWDRYLEEFTRHLRSPLKIEVSPN